MKLVHSEELSALLDGELDAQRALDVRSAIDGDPALRADYETLAQLHDQLRHAAKAVAFTPTMALPAHEASAGAPSHWLAGAAVVLVLLTVRFLPKVGDMALLGLWVQIAGGVAMLAMLGACQDFRVWAGIMGTRSSPHVTTQRTDDTERAA